MNGPMPAGDAPALAALTLAERRERHPREFEVRDAVRQAHALAVLIHGDRQAGVPVSSAVYRDALAGVAELLYQAREALELTTLHAGTVTLTDVPEDVSDLVDHHLLDALEGLPENFAGETLAQAHALVHLLRTADDAASRAHAAGTLSAVVALLGALDAALARVALFDAPPTTAPRAHRIA